MADTGRHLPVRFDPVAWSEDLARTTTTGRTVAKAARDRCERSGAAIAELRQTQSEGHDATVLPHCVKVYLPPPSGKFGMVFEVVISSGQLCLEFIAFGVRHQPHDSHAPTVYQLAHRRLHSTPGAQQRH